MEVIKTVRVVLYTIPGEAVDSKRLDLHGNLNP